MSAEGSLTAKAATEQRVHDQADCVHVQWHQNELWPASVVRLEPSCGSTRSSGTWALLSPHRTSGRVEVLASGLPLQHVSQLAVDVTLRCALTACGRARPNAATVDGAVAGAARRDKETKYSELVDGQRSHLVVVAIETGGRWSSEAYNFVESLARARSRETPHVLRHCAFLGLEEAMDQNACRFLLQGIHWISHVATQRLCRSGWNHT